MGLFSSGPDEETQELIETAKGDSVTADKLTKAETGRMAWDRLNEGPLIDHLSDGEQPHYIFSQQSKSGVRVTDGESIKPEGKYRTMMAVTENCVLFTAGGDNGDSIFSVDYDSIIDIEAESGPEKSDGSGKVTVSLNTEDTSITFPIKTAGSVNLADVHSDANEVQEAVDYISSRQPQK